MPTQTNCVKDPRKYISIAIFHETRMALIVDMYHMCSNQQQRLQFPILLGLIF